MWSFQRIQTTKYFVTFKSSPLQLKSQDNNLNHPRWFISHNKIVNLHNKESLQSFPLTPEKIWINERNLIFFKREFNLIGMNFHNRERTKRKMKGRISKLDSLCERISTFFHNFSGHQLSTVSTFDGFASLMYKEVDAASLAIGRILFGEFLLLWKRGREFKECYCHLRFLAFIDLRRRRS